MKALPVKLIYAVGYEPCSVNAATHVTVNFPGPVGSLTLPVIQRGTRDGTGCWTWNGDTEKPTLRPSVLTTGEWLHCHTWVTDGQAQFLADTTHGLAGQTIDMLDIQTPEGAKP
jgi:hypothetical protein